MPPAKRQSLSISPLAKPTPSHDDNLRRFRPRQPLVEIGTRHRIRPLVQGDLDSLCSVYATINALRLACPPVDPMTTAQSRWLFAQGVEYLHRKRGLEEAVTVGLYSRRRFALARYLAAVASSPRRKFAVERASPDVRTIHEIFRWISDSIFDGTPILIPLMGGLDHLSVVSGTTDKLVLLFDSSGLSHIRKSSCGVGQGFHQISANGLMRMMVLSSY